jgi:hypothetical protein
MSYLTAFNTQVENFTKELGNLYPNDKDIDLAITSLSLLKKTNPRKIHNLIMSSMKSYRTQIFAKDDKFFLDRTFDLEQNYFDTMINLKAYWNGMSENTKKTIWTYLQVLFKLSDKMT